MPRPRKQRLITEIPQDSDIFDHAEGCPQGRPSRRAQCCQPGRDRTVILEPEEYEALALVDYRSLSQIEAAESMGVSRQTCNRALIEARRKVALAVVERRPLRVGAIAEHHRLGCGQGRRRRRACSATPDTQGEQS